MNRVKRANETFSLVDEYFMLQRLKRLGYTRTLDKLNVYKAQCFAIIESEADRIREERGNRGKVNR